MFFKHSNDDSPSFVKTVTFSIRNNLVAKRTKQQIIELFVGVFFFSIFVFMNKRCAIIYFIVDLCGKRITNMNTILLQSKYSGKDRDVIR